MDLHFMRKLLLAEFKTNNNNISTNKSFEDLKVF